MTVTDPIADMLTRIRNAISVRHDSVQIPASNVKTEIARLLKSEGFIENFNIITTKGPQPMIRVWLDYSQQDSAIQGLKRVSKPGLRIYTSKNEMPRPYGGLGISIISTSQGIMTGKDAWRKGIGGEVLCYIW